jgi:hypothetical protein
VNEVELPTGADGLAPSEPWSLAVGDCALRDRLVASLINARIFSHDHSTRHLWRVGEGGLVLAPPAAPPPGSDSDADGLLLCAYPGDGHSNAKRCVPPGRSPTCVPGCRSAAAYSPSKLKSALEEQEGVKAYNELVLSSEVYASRLPFSIEAVFVIRGDSEHAREAENRARNVHRRLLEFYARELASCRGTPSSQLPLVEYSGTRAAAGEAPFRLL